MRPGRTWSACLLVAGALAAAGPARGQDAPPDTTRVRPAADTIPAADSAPVVQAEETPAGSAAGNAPALEIAPGPLSPGSRLVFSRDSIVWNSGYTLADLLIDVPGVYVARTGFAGQPAPVIYGGRGTAGMEILYDGVPMVPLGPDSVAMDPGRISLIGIRRVEVERHPAFLRVYLVSERSERPGARSYLRIVNGDFRTAGYAGNFQYRWRGGVGLDVAADYFNAKGGQGEERDTRWFDLRAAVDWTPSPLVWATYSLRSLTLDRDPTSTDLGFLVPRREESRRESLLRIVAGTRPGRRGLSFEAGLQTTSWRADSASADTLLGERSVNRAFAGLRYGGRSGSVDVTTRVSDYHTPFEAELQAGLLPLSWVVLSGNARLASHRGDRSSRAAWASLGLYRGAFSLVGDVRWADAVAAPMLATDTAQSTLDLGVRAGIQARRITFRAGIEERDAFTPPETPPVPGLPSSPPAPAATFFVGDVTLNLWPITLHGWYADPVSGETSSFHPPKHARFAFTFRSKFLRTFRSGAFDLKFQIALESWSDGTAGVDASGAPIPLPGVSIGELFLQFELARFHAFYTLKNALRSRDGFVPGYEYPRNLQTFGVKWIFRD